MSIAGVRVVEFGPYGQLIYISAGPRPFVHIISSMF